MPAQYLSTSRLTNVIQLIALGHQTGILRAIRGHGPQREMGQIQFIDGQPSAALLGHLTGHPALNVLSNWGECYYAFEDAVLGDDGAMEAAEPAAGPPYGAWPSGAPSFPEQPASRPTPRGMGGSPSNPAHPGWSGYSSTPSAYPQPRPPAPSSAPLGGPGMGATGGLSGRPPSYPTPPGHPSHASGQQPAVPSTAIGASTPLPRRTTRVDLSDPLPLDRRERMVLLLVDGRRSVADLARLTRRSDDEVRSVLGNLKMLGLIE
jgi:hypothetical protein